MTTRHQLWRWSKTHNATLYVEHQRPVARRTIASKSGALSSSIPSPNAAAGSKSDLSVLLRASSGDVSAPAHPATSLDQVTSLRRCWFHEDKNRQPGYHAARAEGHLIQRRFCSSSHGPDVDCTVETESPGRDADGSESFSVTAAHEVVSTIDSFAKAQVSNFIKRHGGQGGGSLSSNGARGGVSGSSRRGSVEQSNGGKATVEPVFMKIHTNDAGTASTHASSKLDRDDGSPRHVQGNTERDGGARDGEDEEGAGVSYLWRARIHLPVAQCLRALFPKEIEAHVAALLAAPSASDRSEGRVRAAEFVRELAALDQHVFGEGLAATQRDAESAAFMHAAAVVDAVGLPLFSMERAQKRHVVGLGEKYAAAEKAPAVRAALALRAAAPSAGGRGVAVWFPIALKQSRELLKQPESPQQHTVRLADAVPKVLPAPLRFKSTEEIAAEAAALKVSFASSPHGKKGADDHRDSLAHDDEEHNDAEDVQSLLGVHSKAAGYTAVRLPSSRGHATDDSAEATRDDTVPGRHCHHHHNQGMSRSMSTAIAKVERIDLWAGDVLLDHAVRSPALYDKRALVRLKQYCRDTALPYGAVIRTARVASRMWADFADSVIDGAGNEHQPPVELLRTGPSFAHDLPFASAVGDAPKVVNDRDNAGEAKTCDGSMNSVRSQTQPAVEVVSSESRRKSGVMTGLSPKALAALERAVAEAKDEALEATGAPPYWHVELHIPNFSVEDLARIRELLGDAKVIKTQQDLAKQQLRMERRNSISGMAGNTSSWESPGGRAPPNPTSPTKRSLFSRPTGSDGGSIPSPIVDSDAPAAVSQAEMDTLLSVDVRSERGLFEFVHGATLARRPRTVFFSADAQHHHHGLKSPKSQRRDGAAGSASPPPPAAFNVPFDSSSSVFQTHPSVAQEADLGGVSIPEPPKAPTAVEESVAESDEWVIELEVDDEYHTVASVPDAATAPPASNTSSSSSCEKDAASVASPPSHSPPKNPCAKTDTVTELESALPSDTAETAKSAEDVAPIAHIVARGRALRKQDAEVLAAMHWELLMDASGQRVFPFDDEKQIRHREEVLAVGRSCVGIDKASTSAFLKQRDATASASQQASDSAGKDDAHITSSCPDVGVGLFLPSEKEPTDASDARREATSSPSVTTDAVVMDEPPLPVVPENGYTQSSTESQKTVTSPFQSHVVIEHLHSAGAMRGITIADLRPAPTSDGAMVDSPYQKLQRAVTRCEKRRCHLLAQSKTHPLGSNSSSESPASEVRAVDKTTDDEFATMRRQLLQIFTTVPHSPTPSLGLDLDDGRIRQRPGKTVVCRLTVPPLSFLKHHADAPSHHTSRRRGAHPREDKCEDYVESPEFVTVGVALSGSFTDAKDAAATQALEILQGVKSAVQDGILERSLDQNEARRFVVTCDSVPVVTHHDDADCCSASEVVKLLTGSSSLRTFESESHPRDHDQPSVMAGVAHDGFRLTVPRAPDDASRSIDHKSTPDHRRHSRSDDDAVGEPQEDAPDGEPRETMDATPMAGATESERETLVSVLRQAAGSTLQPSHVVRSDLLRTCDLMGSQPGASPALPAADLSSADRQTALLPPDLIDDLLGFKPEVKEWVEAFLTRRGTTWRKATTCDFQAARDGGGLKRWRCYLVLPTVLSAVTSSDSGAASSSNLKTDAAVFDSFGADIAPILARNATALNTASVQPLRFSVSIDGDENVASASSSVKPRPFLVAIGEGYCVEDAEICAATHAVMLLDALRSTTSISDARASEPACADAHTSCLPDVKEAGMSDGFQAAHAAAADRVTWRTAPPPIRRERTDSMTWHRFLQHRAKAQRKTTQQERERLNKMRKLQSHVAQRPPASAAVQGESVSDETTKVTIADRSHSTFTKAGAGDEQRTDEPHHVQGAAKVKATSPGMMKPPPARSPFVAGHRSTRPLSPLQRKTSSHQAPSPSAPHEDDDDECPMIQKPSLRDLTNDIEGEVRVLRRRHPRR